MTGSFEQVPFSDTEFVDNPEPRCACLLLLDNSGSMRGNPISELNEGLKVFRDELAADDLASKSGRRVMFNPQWQPSAGSAVARSTDTARAAVYPGEPISFGTCSTHTGGTAVC